MITNQITIEILFAVSIGAAIELIKLKKIKNEQKYLSFKLSKKNIGIVKNINKQLYAIRFTKPPKDIISKKEKSDVSIDPYPRPKKVLADKTLIIPGIIKEPSANLPEVKIFKKSFEKPKINL